MTNGTPLAWTRDTTRERYTITQGTCQGLVWRHEHGDWAALVSRDGTAVSHDSFFALEDAQAWCEAQLTALAASGRCAS